jgi:inorganic pyrophosphatase
MGKTKILIATGNVGKINEISSFFSTLSYVEFVSLKDIAPHRLEEIAEFFRTYKNLEKKVTEILGWQDVDHVLPLVEACIKAAAK